MLQEIVGVSQGFCATDLSADRGDALVILQDFLPQLGRLFLVWTRGWRFAALFNGRLQTGEKFLARLTTIEVLFELGAQGVIQALVEIIGKFREHRFAATGPWFGRAHGR